MKSCPFNCDPDGPLCSNCKETLKAEDHLHRDRKRMRVVELPLGITEDRLVGTLDIEHALKKGEKRFDPGILADANRNFLYVDEVNLLEDHIVDLLLDSAAMGINTVEREGVSFTHPARFILVGTMNPEEGDLRPQLLDRFGLCVQVLSIADKASRMDILRRKAAFDTDPAAFYSSWEAQQQHLAACIIRAQKELHTIPVPDEVLEKIVAITAPLNLDGHRADIVIMKASRSLAAFRGGKTISADDIRQAAQLSLSHRMKRLPFEAMGRENEKLASILAEL